jgi:hypothetical protein
MHMAHAPGKDGRMGSVPAHAMRAMGTAPRMI